MKIAKILLLGLLLTACSSEEIAPEDSAQLYQNYVQDEHKFSLDYPEGWEVSFDNAEDGFTLTMLSPVEGDTDVLQEQIEFVDASGFALPQADLTELRAAIKDTLVTEAGYTFIEESEYKVGPYDGGIITVQDPVKTDLITYVVTIHDGKAYYLYNYYLPESEEKYMPIFEHVVASFKWL